MKKIIYIAILIIVIAAVAQQANKLLGIDLEKHIKLPKNEKEETSVEKQNLVYEESVIIKVVEDSLPSVVTVGISKVLSTKDRLEIDPFDFFGPFKTIPGTKKKIEQNIGSGFIISKDGLIITNKHVVSDSQADYKVITNNEKEYEVKKIYRDPLNDLAIIKIDDNGLKPLKLGDSSKLKLGQLAIAIGTPLGEFTNTITSGIISGLGRGITAGSPFEGFVEKLDNVIQTDAAISAGNSGGPLLNSKGQVIGINTAIAGEAENIGFAIPVNVAKGLIDKFEERGFDYKTPYMGIRYQMVDKQTAILNKIAEGAYIIEVVPDSPAEKAGLEDEDIITEFDGKEINGKDDQGLAKVILEKNAGDKVKIEYVRDGKVKTTTIILEASP